MSGRVAPLPYKLFFYERKIRYYLFDSYFINPLGIISLNNVSHKHYVHTKLYFECGSMSTVSIGSRMTIIDLRY